jgi:hypothetical protein
MFVMGMEMVPKDLRIKQKMENKARWMKGKKK